MDTAQTDTPTDADAVAHRDMETLLSGNFGGMPAHVARARLLYFNGYSISLIAAHIGYKRETVSFWKKKYKWDQAKPVDRIEIAIEARLVHLINKQDKTAHEFKEIDLLMRELERTARIERYTNGGNEADLNPNVRNRNSGPKKKPVRNAIDEEQAAKLEKDFLSELFSYQRHWNEVWDTYRVVNLLKSRQIGATYFWARKALVDAAKTGRNKIFLSASKAQAYIFRSYIIAFAQRVCDVGLTGDPIILSNGAELHFLGTNALTAQGYHGDVFVDEYFWIRGFLDLRKVASGMAMHKKWKLVYSSTPSAISHEGYQYWSGNLYNKNRKKEDRIEIDISHSVLAGGLLCDDGQYRQIVTVEDAVAGGCNLFDLEQLRMEYSPEEYANLLMCQFLDDTLSAFPFNLLQGCAVDSWETWGDVKPFAARPVGDAPVWVGYDPCGANQDGDGRGLVVLLPPTVQGGKHRIIERQRLVGDDYEEQARAILALRDRYEIEHIGIDVTGIGDAVARIVAAQFPLVTTYVYTPLLKAQMVMQALQVMRKGRIEWDAGWTDILQSFLAIRREATAGGRALTYRAGRNAQTGHAELAWAVMHALHHEPIEAPSMDGDSGSFIEFF